MARHGQPVNLDDLPEFQDLPTPEQYHPAADKPNARHESVPDEVLNFIDEMNSAKEYTVTINRIVNGSKALVTKLRNIIPDNDEIGVKYGPGEYRLVFAWPVPNRKTPDTRQIPLIVAEDYATPHREYLERERQKSAALSPSGNGSADLLDTLTKFAPLMGKGSSDNSPILEMVREQGNTLREVVKDLREQMKEDRREANAKFEKLVELVGKQSQVPAVRVPTLREQLEELQGVQKMIGFFNASAPAEDNRPVWLQAVDQIGERVFPLIEALTTGGMKDKIKAGVEIKRQFSSEVGKKLLANVKEQQSFIAALLEKADTPAKKAGIVDLAAKLKIPLPASD